MTEVKIIVHSGDSLDEIILTALEIVKSHRVSYVVFEFNECKIFVKKDSTFESVTNEYMLKLKHFQP